MAGEPARGRQRPVAAVGARAATAPRELEQRRAPDDAAACCSVGPRRSPARVLAIGAHPDDIEIGCAGTILKLIEESAISEVRWVVLSGERRARRTRRAEAPRRCSSGCRAARS